MSQNSVLFKISVQKFMISIYKSDLTHLHCIFQNRPNVCKTREEDVEEEDSEAESKEVDITEKDDDSLIQAFHLNLETCAEKSNKYQCTKM